MPQPLLPLKVVFPGNADYKKPEKTGRDFEPIREVTATFRRELSTKVDSLATSLAPSFTRWSDLPAIAKVTLNQDARAKSYRPSEIFNKETCPIIGTGRPGELLISVTKTRLQRVQARLSETGQRATAHISTIDDISPAGAEVVGIDEGKPIRVRLARHLSAETNLAIDRAFEDLVKQSNLPIKAKSLNYSPGLSIYRLDGMTESAAEVLIPFANIQSMTPFPSYGVVRTSANILRPLTDDTFPQPLSDTEYGLVGILDSGTDPNNASLRPWVTVRDAGKIPQSLQDNHHGTFVAGLITNASYLNHGDSRFPDCSAKIVDIVAFDRSGQVAEQDLLEILDAALLAHPNVRVWNLSLSLLGKPCHDVEVSEFAAALDHRSKLHNVLFVVAAGNLAVPPFRPWPLDGTATDDRIRPPADSVRALTVGGLAHLETPNTLARKECPSPFSRRGPGIAGLMKPDLSHYAGNIDALGRCNQTGVISLDGQGNIAEDVGTSFSCPQVSALAAAVYHELDAPDAFPSLLQVKAMLLHSGFMRTAPLDSATVNYHGVGRPGNLAEILNCSQSAATLLMNVKVGAGRNFEKSPFPIPTCLMKAGHLRGEMFMTVLADCELDRKFSLEYCRTNVLATLGTLHSTKMDKKGRPKYTRQLNSALSMGEELDEDVLDEGFAWSPAKFYYRRFQRGPTGPWRLQVRAINRAEHDDDSEIDVVILLTLRALEEGAQVYDELVRQMQQLAWTVVDLPVQSRIRQRPR